MRIERHILSLNKCIGIFGGCFEKTKGIGDRQPAGGQDDLPKQLLFCGA
jgi:hypothetical protein